MTDQEKIDLLYNLLIESKKYIDRCGFRNLYEIDLLNKIENVLEQINRN